jgi:hypothetical protein
MSEILYKTTIVLTEYQIENEKPDGSPAFSREIVADRIISVPWSSVRYFCRLPQRKCRRR